MTCSDCFTGFVHEGKPRGEVTKVYGLDCYISGPLHGKPAKGIVVILPDCWGWVSNNTRLLADRYADVGGYKVYLPDFMNGTSAPTSALWMFRQKGISKKLFDYYAFRTTIKPFAHANRFEVAWPIIRQWFIALRENEGTTLPVGAAGFCWGGKFTVTLAFGHDLVDGRPLIDAGFTGHPSNLKIPDEIQKMTIPVSFAIGDVDSTVNMEKVEEIEKAVNSLPETSRGEIRVYKDALHGFCVRADHSDLDLSVQAAEAEKQCIDWFKLHLEHARLPTAAQESG